MADNPAFDGGDEKTLDTVDLSNGNASVAADLPPKCSVTIVQDDDHDAKADIERQRLRDREPFFYCRWVTARPKLALGLTLSGHILSLVITGILVASGYDLFPISFQGLPVDVRSDTDYLRGLSWRWRYSDKSVLTAQSVEAATTPERTQFAEALELFFEIPGGNVLTAHTLKKIREVENEFISVPEYTTKMCLLFADSKACYKPWSLLRFFDGTYVDLDPHFARDDEFTNIPRALNAANKYKETKALLYYLTGVDSVVTSTYANSTITRVRIFNGFPLPGYKNSTDRNEDQKEELRKLMVKHFDPMGKKYFKHGLDDGRIDFIYASLQLFFNYIMTLVFTDFALVIASIFFIFVFMRIQTGSFLISGLAMFSILCGFSTANLIYRVVFDFRYFGIFHVLTVFIILGIGADDVFIFYDTWRQSKVYSYKSLAHRLSDVYRNSAFAMLFTSLTTAVAFIVSATSSLLAVWTFGVFSGMLVLINYISVIVFLPTVIIAYHLWWEHYKFCCCCPSGTPGDASVTDASMAQKAEKPRHNFVVRFFDNQYYRFITHKIARWVIIFLFAILIAVSIYYASKLAIYEGQIKFLKDSTNFGKWLITVSSAFKATGNIDRNTVYLVWGLKEQDLRSCHATDFECYGDTVWDNEFNLNSIESQQALLGLCKKLKTLSKKDTDRLYVRRGLIDDKPEVRCFIDDMATFYAAEEKRSIYPDGTDLKVPVNMTKAQIVMDYNNHIYQKDITDPNFWRYFEIMSSFWLQNGFQSTVDGEQMREYNELLGEALDTYSEMVELKGRNYTYGTKLRFAAISVNTTLKEGVMGFPTGLPIRDAWEEFTVAEMKKMPKRLQNGYQLIGSGNEEFNLWHWFTVQKTLLRSAITGIIVGLCLAFPILVIATANVIVGLLATITLVCITLTVVAVIPMAGWKLSIVESLNMTLVVGLSVDYVVHLAEGYSRSAHALRKERVRDSLRHVGVSVISGACTTLGASIVLLFAQILFFRQFGIFMFSTLGFSLLYALGFFTTALAIIGPQHEFGSLKPLLRWLGKRLRCCRSTAANCEITQ